MKQLLTLFSVMLVCLMSYAQDIEKDGTLYHVKNERIFLDGKDVTETLKLEEKTAILKHANLASEQIKLKETELKEEAKIKKEAEKKQKQAEKALKQQQKAQDRLTNASKKLKSSQKKYDKLKRKGKLSPKDEAKWLEKLEDLREDIERAKKKI